jgi:hypothetical protein
MRDARTFVKRVHRLSPADDQFFVSYCRFILGGEKRKSKVESRQDAPRHLPPALHAINPSLSQKPPPTSGCAPQFSRTVFIPHF